MEFNKIRMRLMPYQSVDKSISNDRCKLHADLVSTSKNNPEAFVGRGICEMLRNLK